MHEMAHKFENDRNWCGDGEASVDLLVSYALESIRGACWHNYETGEKIEGAQHRRQIYMRSAARHKVGNLKRSREGSSHAASVGAATDIINLGLVDVVGWDTYKQAMHSYFGEKVLHGGGLRDGHPLLHPGGYAGKSREFLDRLEHFGGKPGIHRTIPVMAAVVDKHFSFQPNILAQRLEAEKQGVASVPAQPQGRIATPAATPTPTPTNTVDRTPTPAQNAAPAINPRTGQPLRSWTNPNI